MNNEFTLEELINIREQLKTTAVQMQYAEIAATIMRKLDAQIEAKSETDKS